MRIPASLQPAALTALTPEVAAPLSSIATRAPAPRAKPEFEQLSVTSEVYDEKCNIRVGAVLQYLFGRRGPLATTGCDHGAFLRTSGEARGPRLGGRRT